MDDFYLLALKALKQPCALPLGDTPISVLKRTQILAACQIAHLKV
jgi:hypothetical protein